MQKGEIVVYQGSYTERRGDYAVVAEDYTEHDTACSVIFEDGHKLWTSLLCIVQRVVQEVS